MAATRAHSFLLPRELGTPAALWWIAILLLAMLLTASLPATAQAPAAPAGDGPNRIYFGQDIYVAANQRIHNAVCLFCSVQVEGDLSGRALVLFGNLTVTGRVDRNVVVVAGNAVVDSQARILGSTSVIAGNAVYESDESLSGDALVIGGHVSNLASSQAHRRHRFALSPALAYSIAIVALLLLMPLWFVRRPAVRSS